MMSFNSDVSLCIFCSDILSIAESGLLIAYLLIIELEIICVFQPSSTLSLKLSAYMFRVVMSS